MKIYVASSWKNNIQPLVIQKLKNEGLDVYDFRSGDGFHWEELDRNWKNWKPEEFVDILKQPIVENNFNDDFSALKHSNVVIMVNPCGSSAHLELGYAIGANKITAILLSDGQPELMYKMADKIFTDINELISWIKTAVN